MGIVNTALAVGMLVAVKWGTEPEYHGCVGVLSKIEEIPEYNSDVTVLRDVKCRDNGKEKTIIGIRTDHLEPASAGDRSWYWRK